MKDKIVITGGTGMVGQSLQKIMPNATYLSSKDCDLSNLDETIKFFKKKNLIQSFISLVE